MQQFKTQQQEGGGGGGGYHSWLDAASCDNGCVHIFQNQILDNSLSQATYSFNNPSRDIKVNDETDNI